MSRRHRATRQPRHLDVVPARARLGARGEELAVRHLLDDGYEVLARNWRIHDGELRGELDVVAVDREVGLLVVVEVKTRRGDGFGGPLAAVTPAKQDKVRALALAFLRASEVPWRHVRFDVVAVWLEPGSGPRLEHVVDAF